MLAEGRESIFVADDGWAGRRMCRCRRPPSRASCARSTRCRRRGGAAPARLSCARRSRSCGEDGCAEASSGCSRTTRGRAASTSARAGTLDGGRKEDEFLGVRVAEVRYRISSRKAVLGREVDDHVRDREREARLRLADQVLLEPVRPARRMRRDDDLVGAERPQRVLDRDERVVVADLAANREPGRLEPGDGRLEAALGVGSCAVDVRGPVPHLRGQRGRRRRGAPSRLGRARSSTGAPRPRRSRSRRRGPGARPTASPRSIFRGGSAAPGPAPASATRRSRRRPGPRRATPSQRVHVRRADDHERADDDAIRKRKASASLRSGLRIALPSEDVDRQCRRRST